MAERLIFRPERGRMFQPDNPPGVSQLGDGTPVQYVQEDQLTPDIKQVWDRVEQKGQAEGKTYDDKRVPVALLDWKQKFDVNLQSNVTDATKDVADLGKIDRNGIPELAFETFQEYGRHRVRELAFRQLRAEYRKDGVTVGSLLTLINTLDRDLGQIFKESDVRAHYADHGVAATALWNWGKAMHKGEQPAAEDVDHLPTVAMLSGTEITSLLDLLWNMSDLEAKYLRNEEGDPLIKIMARLAKSDHNVMKVDITNGQQVVERDGQWYYKANGQVVKDADLVKDVYLTTDNRRAVKIYHRVDGRMINVAVDSIKKHGLNDPTKLEFLDDDFILQSYDLGVTPTAKICPRPGQESELELTAQRIADALGERIVLTTDESWHLYNKSRRNASQGLPNTPRENSYINWYIAHKRVIKAWDTVTHLAQSNVDPASLPPTLLNLKQPQKPFPFEFSSGRTMQFTTEKRGRWIEILGTTWDELATLTHAEILEYARETQNKVPGPDLPFARADQVWNVVNELNGVRGGKGYIAVEDVDKSFREGKIADYAPTLPERQQVLIRLMRDVSPTEFERIQLVGDESAMKTAADKMRKGLALDQWLAWYVSNLRIPTNRLNLREEYVQLPDPSERRKDGGSEWRARQIAQATFTNDLVVVHDALFSSDQWPVEWKKLIDRLYKFPDGRVPQTFIGGVVFETNMKMYKRFQEGKRNAAGEVISGVIDSQGNLRAITMDELYRWMGVEIYFEPYTTEYGWQLLRRRFRPIGDTEQSPEWRAYIQDPHHGVDPKVAASLREFFNAGPNPIVPKANSSLYGQVLLQYFDPTNLYKDKYYFNYIFLSQHYPGRNWTGKVLNEYQKGPNSMRPPNELLQDPQLLSTVYLGESGYRWGFVPGREPLGIQEAFAHMHGWSPLEVPPDPRFLDSKIIDQSGNQVSRTAPEAGDVVLYRIPKQSMSDERLGALGEKHKGWVTWETLLDLPRKDALIPDAIEAAGEKFIYPRGGAPGVLRRPMQLARHPLHMKVPWIMVEKSFEYQFGQLVEDIRVEMGQDAPYERVRAEAERRFDNQEVSANSISSIVDNYFYYFNLHKSGVLSFDEFMDQCNMAGCHFRFRSEAVKGKQVLVPDGMQGGAYLMVLDALGIKDPQMEQFMARLDEDDAAFIQGLSANASRYLAGSGSLPFVAEAIQSVGKTQTVNVRKFERRQRIGLIAAGGTFVVGGPTAVALGLATGSPAVGAAVFCLPGVIIVGSVLYNTARIAMENNATRIEGKLVNGGMEYKPAMTQSPISLAASAEKHWRKRAVYEYREDDVIGASKKDGVSRQLLALYDEPWATYHNVPLVVGK